MWVYRRNNNKWVVGFYAPSGMWHPDSDWDTKEEAAKRVHWLNGGNDE